MPTARLTALRLIACRTHCIKSQAQPRESELGLKQT